MPRAASAAARLLATAAILGSWGAGCRDEPAVTLRLSDQVGQVSRYRLVNEVRTSARVEGPSEGRGEIAGPVMEQKTRVEMLLTEKLVSLDSGGVRTFESTLDSLDVSGSAGGEPIPMPGAGRLREELRAPVRTRRTAYGAVVGLETGNPMLRAMAEAFQVARAAVQLPQHTVRVGEAWTHELRLPVPNLGIALRAALESRLKELRPGNAGPEAVVEVGGTVAAAQDEAGGLGGRPGSMKAKGTLTGLLRFDVSAGRVIESTYSYRITMDVEPRSGITFRTVADGTTTLALVGT